MNSSPSAKQESSENKSTSGDQYENDVNQEEQKLSSKQSDHDVNTKMSLWEAVWDANAQAYYWWNTETNQTTWINPTETIREEATNVPVMKTADSNNPLDFLLDRIDKVVKKKLDNGEPVENEELHADNSSYTPYNQYFEPQYDGTANQDTEYVSKAHFNARTGRFTTEEDANRLNPENLTIENRAKRQMQFYFDVDSYTEERNSQAGKVTKRKQPLTKKELERFKKQKQEKKAKKAREWLLQ